MGESVKYVTGGYKLRARPAEFAAMGEYLDMFTQKLGTIDRIAQRIIKEQSGKKKQPWKHWHSKRSRCISLWSDSIARVSIECIHAIFDAQPQNLNVWSLMLDY